MIAAYEQLGLTEADLARSLGVSRVIVNKWRRGLAPLPSARRIQIAAFLWCTRQRFETWLAETPRRLQKGQRWQALRDDAAMLGRVIDEEMGSARELHDDFVAEVRRVEAQLQPVWREADQLRGKTRQ